MPHNQAPQYLSSLFKIKENIRDLRSNGKELLLEIPYTNRKSYGDRSFRVNGAKIWNELPNSIKLINLNFIDLLEPCPQHIVHLVVLCSWFLQ